MKTHAQWAKVYRKQASRDFNLATKWLSLVTNNPHMTETQRRNNLERFNNYLTDAMRSIFFAIEHEEKSSHEGGMADKDTTAE